MKNQELQTHLSSACFTNVLKLFTLYLKIQYLIMPKTVQEYQTLRLGK